MGAWFPKDKGGIFKPLGQWGKSKCQRENPSNCQLPFLSYSPNHLLLLEVGWVGYCIGWVRYVSPNSNGRSHQFLENPILTYGASYFPKMLPIPSCMEVVVFPHVFGALGILHSRFSFSSPFSLIHVSSLRQLELPVCIHPQFWLFTESFPWMGGRFCNARGLGCLPHVFLIFHAQEIRFCVAERMAIKDSRFWGSKQLFWLIKCLE